MDILKAGNVERLLFAITNDPMKVRTWMSELEHDGIYTVDNETAHTLQELFYADWVSNRDSLLHINQTVKRTGYLMDTHTSVAHTVAERYLDQTKESLPIITCSTAHWAKFPSDVRDALTGDYVRAQAPSTGEDVFTAIRQIQEIIPHVSVPDHFVHLAEKKVRHGDIFDASVNGIKEAINSFL
jgi:threonine synthase